MDKTEMLNQLISKFTGGNKAQFAQLLGVKPQTISTWISRNTFDSELIYSKCEGVNAKWLLTGEGNMLSDLLGNSEGIPLIPLSAMAGPFMGEQRVLECECERYVVPAFQGADFLIHVKGDSMQPNYKSGDIVACKRVSMDRLFFQWNHVYVLNTDQGALIKRVQPGKDENHVSIVSDNEAYAPFELPLQCIYNVALVMGTIRLE